jgi:menaquinone-dependent protoporphyrinogen oxidase
MDKPTTINRRRFLLLSGGILGASILACSGGLIVATSSPPMNFAEFSCGKENTMQNILVTYASRSGSTAEIAQAIAEQLCQQGARVDVKAVDDVKEIALYDAVVVGSAIRMGRWLPAASKFVETHSAALRAKPVAIFTVHMLALDDSEASRQQRASYTEPVHALITPQHEVFFAGRMDFSKLNLFDRLVSKMVQAEEADLRNWQAIHTWTDQIFQSEGVLQ